jgi:hypothetical protein
MNKPTRLLLCLPLLLSVSACSLMTYGPKLGTGERRWVSNTVAPDLVYIEGNVKAYRSSGAYYYFRDRKLVQVTPELLSADKVASAPATK